MSESSLIPVESVNSLEVFTNGGLKKLLERIEQEVAGFVPDLETATGRKEIASMAHKVSRSKVAIDNAGKELVADWKQKAKVVDASRREAREFLDDLRDKVRQPLTEWEEEEKRKIEAKRKWEELGRLQEEAYAEDEIWEREQEIKRREAEIQAQEEERQREEAVRREAEERAQREEQLKKEVEERAKREAEEEIRRERERAERAEQEAREAEERAEREKQEAIEQERERVRREEEARKVEEDRRKADIENRRKINGSMLEAFTAQGLGEQTAKKVITLVATGSIPNMHIRY